MTVVADTGRKEPVSNRFERPPVGTSVDSRRVGECEDGRVMVEGGDEGEGEGSWRWRWLWWVVVSVMMVSGWIDCLAGLIYRCCVWGAAVCVACDVLSSYGGRRQFSLVGAVRRTVLAVPGRKALW
jgi:hypothetical protein